MVQAVDLPMCTLINLGVKVGKCYMHHTDNFESWLYDSALRTDFIPLVESDAGCKYGHTPEKCKCRYEAMEGSGRTRLWRTCPTSHNCSGRSTRAEGR